jgi:hypothetical protein
MPTARFYRSLAKYCVWLGAACLLFSPVLHAQEIEARAYSNAPIGMNFLTGGMSLGNLADSP